MIKPSIEKRLERDSQGGRFLVHMTPDEEKENAEWLEQREEARSTPKPFVDPVVALDAPPVKPLSLEDQVLKYGAKTKLRFHYGEKE